MSGWIGVDLDGTLAHYDGWKGVEHIGAPIERMLQRVMGWINEDREVRIFTARVSVDQGAELEMAHSAIERWCLKYIGQVLPVTCSKDFGMIELWDDRCVQVEFNTGFAVDGRHD